MTTIQIVNYQNKATFVKKRVYSLLIYKARAEPSELVVSLLCIDALCNKAQHAFDCSCGHLWCFALKDAAPESRLEKNEFESTERGDCLLKRNAFTARQLAADWYRRAACMHLYAVLAWFVPIHAV
jgi:hypothetical protein